MKFTGILSSISLVTLALPATSSPVHHDKRFDPKNFKAEMLKAHNFYRHQHGAADLVWNDEAAANAQAWVNTCSHDHQPNNKFGENLVGGSAQDPWGVFINRFGAEREKYDWNKPGFSMETGHFTQVVWKNTKSVGCAWNSCPGFWGTFVACEYGPPGNVIGQFPANVGKQIHGEPSSRYHRE